MNTSLIVRIVIFILLFALGWQVESRTVAFIFFSIASCILIYPLFINKK